MMLRVASLAAALSMCSVQALAAENERARDLAATCTGCHGTDGHSAGTIPSIAGMKADDMLNALTEFKAGQRPATVMHQIAKGYTQAQLEQIAAYFAARK